MNKRSNIYTVEELLMKTACDLSLTSVLKGGGPFGCVITDSSFNILSQGHNQVTLNKDPTAHAEIVAIRYACKILDTHDLSNCKLFTSCEPCPMCLSAIYWSNIKDVYYCNTRNDAKKSGFNDEYIYDELKKDINERNIQLKKINISNSRESLFLWDSLQDKICY